MKITLTLKTEQLGDVVEVTKIIEKKPDVISHLEVFRDVLVAHGFADVTIKGGLEDFRKHYDD